LLCEEERSLQENQAKMDVVRLLNVADEQIRLIGSVRVSYVAASLIDRTLMSSRGSQAAFASRVKSYFAWQNAESEARRSKVQYERERGKKGGKYAPYDNNDSVIPDIAQVNHVRSELPARILANQIFFLVGGPVRTASTGCTLRFRCSNSACQA